MNTQCQHDFFFLMFSIETQRWRDELSKENDLFRQSLETDIVVYAYIMHRVRKYVVVKASPMQVAVIIQMNEMKTHVTEVC
jgi:hypothetical protein